jgi:SP family general alpha glucoside:H+ symporter-like MFS transporter
MLDTSKDADQTAVEHVSSSQEYDPAITASLAREGATAEHELSPMDAIKAYPAAVFWTLMVSMTIIMEGYDTIL